GRVAGLGGARRGGAGAGAGDAGSEGQPAGDGGAEPGAGEGDGPLGEGGLAGTLMPDWWQGAVRTGRSHWRARSYQDRLAWARRNRGRAGGGLADRSQDNPQFRCQPILGPGPPPGSG